MNKTFQRILTLLLVLLMVCGMFPAALATEADLEDTSTEPTQPTGELPDTTSPVEPETNPIETPTDETGPPDIVDTVEPTEEATKAEETEESEPHVEETTEPDPTDPVIEAIVSELEEEVSASRVTLGTENVPMLFASRAAVKGTHYHRAIIWLSSDDAKLNFTYKNKDYSVDRLYVHGVIADGSRSVAYCVDPGVITTETSGGYSGSETAWDDLDIDTQTAVGLAVLYGAPNGMSSSTKKTMLTYEFATQIIIHEILLGYRSNLPPYTCNNDKIITKFGTNADGSTNGKKREITSGSYDYSSLHGEYMNRSVLRSAYDTIAANMAAHYVLPSFASRYNAAAKTYEMTKQSDGTYAVTLTDTNNILSKCTFTNGNGLTYSVSGNKLTITSKTPFDTVKSCASNGSSGASKNVPNLEYQTFYLWQAGSNQRLITLEEATSDPVPLYFNVKISAGDLAIQKNTEDGLNKGGWRFGAYSDAACTNLIAGPAVTNSSGALTFEGLSAGTVWVKELGHEDAAINAMYQCASINPQQVAITAGKTATVTFKNNLRYGSITFRKATTSGIGVELGWTAKLWKVESNGTKTYIGSGTTKKDKADPTYTFTNLLPGKYILQEDPDSGKAGYSLDTTAYEVTVTAGKNTAITITNVSLGNIRIVKETNTGKDVAGRKFNIFTDEARTKLYPGSPFTSGEDGTILTEAPPGVYYIQEVDESAANPGWVFDTSVKKVTVKAHETASVTFTNIQQGYGKIIKDMPDGGSKEGWPFDLHRASDNQFIATYTSGSDGTVNTDWLLPGEYLVYEQLDEQSVYWCESENPQKVIIKAGETAEVTFTNRLKPGKIAIQKVDITGEPLAGAEFLLEWSVDGKTWQPVSHTDSQYVLEGTCTSAGLTTGRLISGEDGIVEFTGLHPERLYRLTETAAPDGYRLLADTAYEGGLPADKELTIQLTVVNVPTFELPKTGSKSMLLMPISLALAAAMCGGILLISKRKKQ